MQLLLSLSVPPVNRVIPLEFRHSVWRERIRMSKLLDGQNVSWYVIVISISVTEQALRFAIVQEQIETNQNEPPSPITIQFLQFKSTRWWKHLNSFKIIATVNILNSGLVYRQVNLLHFRLVNISFIESSSQRLNRIVEKQAQKNTQ